MGEDDVIGWAVLELMGHRKLAGYVQAVEVAGVKMLRLDVPACPDKGREAVTQFYSAAALYCLTPTTEAIAMAMIQTYWPEPVSRYALPALPKPSAADRYGDYDYDDDRDDD